MAFILLNWATVNLFCDTTIGTGLFFYMSKYSDLLKDGRWQERRLLVLQRDKFACTICKKTEFLDVHHLDYLGDLKPWEYPNDMLITVCDECHDKENTRYKSEKLLLRTLKIKGFMVGDLVALSCKFDTQENFTQSLLTALRKMQNG